MAVLTVENLHLSYGDWPGAGGRSQPFVLPTRSS